MKKGGFSLIELLVVVAIIAALAAIAVPSYKGYVAKTRISALWPILDGIKINALNYMSKNNQWPNATQIGYTSGNNTDITTPSAINQYFTALSITPTTTGTCNAKIVAISWTLDYQAIGISNATTYMADLYIGIMNNGYTATMCRETIDGSMFTHEYIGDVCAYGDIASFNTALCS